MFVKPAPGRSVPDPERHGLLATEGRQVDSASAYWTRRIDDGDVELVDPADTSPGSIVERPQAADAR